MNPLPLPLTLRSALALATACSLAAAPARAAGPGPYSTGVDDDHGLLAQGAVDPHYQIVGSPAFGPAAYVERAGVPITTGAWVDAGGSITANPHPNSSWLVPSPDLFFTDQPGVTDTITYRTQFDLSAYSAPGWRIEGGWAADDSGVMITLNGVPLLGPTLGRPEAGADHWTRFRVTEGILPGLNTFEFTTRSTQSPTGLRVEFMTTAVPEPAMAWLWALGAVGLWAGLRGRQREHRQLDTCA